MLLTITLSLKNNIENFDITTEKGASSAFEFVGQNTEYKVLNIESDGLWANFNEGTILDEDEIWNSVLIGGVRKAVLY